MKIQGRVLFVFLNVSDLLIAQDSIFDDESEILVKDILIPKLWFDIGRRQ